MHHTFMHAHIPNPKLMVLAEMSTFGIFSGRNVRGRNVRAETSVAEMSVAEMSEHRLFFTKIYHADKRKNKHGTHQEGF